ncbi:MAG TPA: bifunctional 4-hydroxy-2-oxoglutarate aldolase/2-dehydro-3-deoxy-phosphogluconate aldolase [Pseudonocardiaceae bacterium]|jgi:2-dehydro-3-deoxyphosphogluconate aldolase/(4S)-4-hydroxy-2-oxoglutarate aldolase
MGDFFADLFAGRPLMAILRGFDAERTVAMAERAWELGVTAVEVTVEVPSQVESLRAVVAAGHDQLVGAGTVYTVDQVDAVRAAGAAFTVAPGHDPVVAEHSHRAGLPHLPGVATPTELQTALRAGHTWLKLFPAGVLGTAHIEALRGPFPGVHLVATGGIDATNAQDFLAAGADVVAVGSALADPAQLPALAALISAP